jgi:hypothetical protein
MSRYSEGFRTTNTNTGAVIEFIGSSTQRSQLVEIGFTPTTGTICSIGLGYPAAAGITPTTPVTVLAESDNSSITLTTALAWGTPPTLPTYFYRRATIPAGGSEAIVWTFSKGLLLAPSSSIVLWLFATGPALDGWAVFEQ